MRRHRARSAGDSLHLARRQCATADRRGVVQLEHAGAGRRAGPASDSLVVAAVRIVLLEPGRADGGEGGGARIGRARSALRTRYGSDRCHDSHQEPAVSRGRRADEQGSGGDGPRSGRHGDRALHHRAEEAAGNHAPAKHHAIDGRRRAVRSGLRSAHQPAAYASSAYGGRTRRLHRPQPRGDGHAS